MKREKFNIRSSVCQVVPVSGYTFRFGSYRFGVVSGRVAGFGPGWMVYDLASGTYADLVVRRLDRVPACIVEFVLGHRKQLDLVRDAFADCNPGLVPAVDVWTVRG